MGENMVNLGIDEKGHFQVLKNIVSPDVGLKIVHGENNDSHSHDEELEACRGEKGPNLPH